MDHFRIFHVFVCVRNLCGSDGQAEAHQLFDRSVFCNGDGSGFRRFEVAQQAETFFKKRLTRGTLIAATSVPPPPNAYE